LTPVVLCEAAARDVWFAAEPAVIFTAEAAVTAAAAEWGGGMNAAVMTREVKGVTICA
jgi:hypothetical protein